MVALFVEPIAFEVLAKLVTPTMAALYLHLHLHLHLDLDLDLPMENSLEHTHLAD